MLEIPSMMWKNMIFYTGTHDNDTIMQWYGNMSAAARRKIRRMLKKAGASQGSVRTDSCSIPCRIRQNMRSFRWQIFLDLEKRAISTHREPLVLELGVAFTGFYTGQKRNCRNLADGSWIQSDKFVTVHTTIPRGVLV